MKMMMTTAIAALVLSTTAFAHEGPCKEVREACTKAGFYKGGHKAGKGLWKDCIDPLKNGQTVSGVTVSQDTVNACKAKVAAKKAGKSS